MARKSQCHGERNRLKRSGDAVGSPLVEQPVECLKLTLTLQRRQWGGTLSQSKSSSTSNAARAEILISSSSIPATYLPFSGRGDTELGVGLHLGQGRSLQRSHWFRTER